MTLLYDALETLARDKANEQPEFARLTIEQIESAYNKGRIDLVEKSQLIDILTNF